MKYLDPKTLLLFFCKNFVGTAYILPFWFIGVVVLEQLWVNNLHWISKEFVILLLDIAGIIFFFLLALGSYYWGWLTFMHFTYELLPDGLHIRKGVIIRKHIHIPFHQIENVELLINPLLIRFFQLYSIGIKKRELTDGMPKKKYDEYIVGLSAEEARLLRADLLRNTHITI